MTGGVTIDGLHLTAEQARRVAAAVHEDDARRLRAALTAAGHGPDPLNDHLRGLIVLAARLLTLPRTYTTSRTLPPPVDPANPWQQGKPVTVYFAGGEAPLHTTIRDVDVCGVQLRGVGINVHVDPSGRYAQQRGAFALPGHLESRTHREAFAALGIPHPHGPRPLAGRWPRSLTH